MQRLRALLRFTALVLFEAGALLGLWAAGTVERWQVDWAHLWRWMGAVPPTDAAVGLLRVAGLVVVGYLALTTALHFLAAVVRLRGLMRFTGALTLPGIRRTVERTLAVGITASVALSHAPAFAQEPAGGWVKPFTAVTASVAGGRADGAVPPAVEPTAVAPGEWTVAAGDNYWDIATAALAHERGVDPGALSDDEVRPYWLAMIEQSQQGNSSGDPNLIFPGEVETLPALTGTTVGGPPVVVTAPTPAPAPAPAAAPTVVQEPPSVVAPPPTAAPTTVAPTTTAVVPATAPVADATTALPSDPPLPVGRVDGRPEDTSAITGKATPAAATKPSHGIGSTKLIGMGIFGAGLAAEVARRRRKASRLRGPDEELPEAEPEVQDIELETRVAADVDGVRFVDAALRALAALVDVDSQPPAPVGIILGESELVVVFEEAAVAPAPFRGRGTHWSISRSVSVEDLEAMGADVTMPAPALVTLGRTADGAEVAIEVECTGMVSIVGPGAGDIVTAAGIQLATAPWSQTVEVILVGFPTPPSGPTTRAVDSLVEVIDELEEKGRRTARILRPEVDEDLATSGDVLSLTGAESAAATPGDTDTVDLGPACESTFEARLRGVAEAAWVPTVVVCASPLEADLGRRLLGIVASGEAAGVAALVNGAVHDSPWTLTIERDGIVVDDLGVTVVSTQGIGPREAAGIRDLLESAARGPVPASPPEDLAMPAEAAPVIVHLYGPVEIDGFPRPQKGKSVEAFAYLACHRGHHIDGDRLRGVLWPEGCKPRTLNDTMYFLRQVAGEHVPELAGSTRLYQVGAAVVTSVQLLERALEASRGLPPDQGQAELRAALDLVRGRPFDAPTRAGHGGGRSQTAWEWAFAENHVSHAERVAGDAAHRLCDLALEAGDPERAAWAVAQGLRADTENPQLRRDEMRVARARNDRAGLDAALDAAVDDAAVDDDEVDPATVALYSDLVAEVEEDRGVLVG